MLEKPADQVYLVDLDAGVLRLTLNRPEFGNALPSAALPVLERLFRTAQADPAVRCILIDANGTVFSAGGDLVGFAHSVEQEVEARQADFARRLDVVGRLVQAVVAFDRPIIAAIRGAAAGLGLLYPLAADVAIGDESAAFGILRRIARRAIGRRVGGHRRVRGRFGLCRGCARVPRETAPGFSIRDMTDTYGR